MFTPVSKLCTPGPAIQKRTDVQVTGAELFLLPVQTRVPLKFGAETLDTVTCARVRLEVRDRSGRRAFGWGETPLSVQWAWPAKLRYASRCDAMVRFSKLLVTACAECDAWGHPLEVGHTLLEIVLPRLREQFNEQRTESDKLPLLAALVCLSAFDIALHDAYGVVHGVPTYHTYHEEWMNRDLAAYLVPAYGGTVDFRDRYPQEFLVKPATRLPAWHLVGGLDPLVVAEPNAPHTDDGYPTVLSDWITRDGLYCLKVKLRGNDSQWDYERIVRVGQIALRSDVRYLSTDFNCTVTEPSYVTAILDRLAKHEPDIDRLLLYVEQPFPYELEEYPLDVHNISARKPLFMDESAHSWQQIRAGRGLGWTGVALKTCKTQTGAILSLCWAKSHGMDVMVQDLTNPMLAQIPHVLLAAHAGTIMGVETNAMQFYPQASAAEATIHPGLYVRREGQIDLSSVTGPGFGYAGAQDARPLPNLAARFSRKVSAYVPAPHLNQ